MDLVTQSFSQGSLKMRSWQWYHLLCMCGEAFFFLLAMNTTFSFSMGAKKARDEGSSLHIAVKLLLPNHHWSLSSKRPSGHNLIPFPVTDFQIAAVTALTCGKLSLLELGFFWFIFLRTGLWKKRLFIGSTLSFWSFISATGWPPHSIFTSIWVNKWVQSF